MNVRQFASNHSDGLLESIKVAPPVTYAGATVAGMSLPDWAAALAIAYTLILLVQMGFRFCKWFRRRGWNDA